jgi:hypothetical protein
MTLRLLLLVLLIPAAAAAQQPSALDAIGDEVPGQGGDAVLPAGYRAVLWGISPLPMQHVRGVAMEELPAAEPEVKVLIEAPPPGERSAIATVKHWFWREKLYRVEVYYTSPLSKTEGRELQKRYESKYGEPQYAIKPLDPDFGPAKLPPGEERRWTWSDPFTIQSLQQDTRNDEWIMVRQSKVIEYQRLLENRRQREEGEAQTDKIKNLDID